MLSPWESLGAYSKSCIINKGYADTLWIKSRTLVTVLTKVAETLKISQAFPIKYLQAMHTRTISVSFYEKIHRTNH